MKPDRFVQVETGLRRSKLVDRLVGDLDVHPAIVVGCLVLLWSEALDARTRGDLSERSDRWIEEAAGWPGAPGAFAAAIRKHHLDDAGVIRDWLTKYGKLDGERAKGAGWKREQRERARQSSGQSSDESSDVHSMSSGQTEDGPVFSSISLSPSVVDLDKNQDQEKNPELELALARFGEEFAQWPWQLARASRNRSAVLAEIITHLDGMHGPKYSAPIVAYAARQYAASKEYETDGFKPLLFAGFVKRAARKMDEKGGAIAARREEKFITNEDRERERESREEAEVERTLADFERTHGDEYAAIVEKAEAAVDPKFKGIFREPIVKAEIVKRVRLVLAQEGRRAAV